MTVQQSAAFASQPSVPAIGDAAFQILAQRLQQETGIVLTEAKRGLAVSRLSRRLRSLGLANFDAYCDLLKGPNGASELNEMVLLLTTNVTRFFREPHHFDILVQKVLPNLISKAKAGGRVRIWSAGCSSGEEPYSIAMSIMEAIPQAPQLDIRVLATDIDSNVLQTGQTAKYKLSADEQAEFPILSKYTRAVQGMPQHFEVLEEVKSLVQFGRLNLQDPWPMRGKFDAIFCRNVVIYFSTETQQELWPRFADALVDGGHLMIGHSERVTGTASKVLRSVGITHYELNTQGNTP